MNERQSLNFDNNKWLNFNISEIEVEIVLDLKKWCFVNEFFGAISFLLNRKKVEVLNFLVYCTLKIKLKNFKICCIMLVLLLSSEF